METVGNYLKRQRELRSIPLQEIAQITKIHVKKLTALESDDLASLPPPAIAKGFVRSYAKAIGLDPEESLLHFEEHLRATVGTPPQRFRWIKSSRWQFRPWVGFLIFLAVVLAAAYLSSR